MNHELKPDWQSLAHRVEQLEYALALTSAVAVALAKLPPKPEKPKVEEKK